MSRNIGWTRKQATAIAKKHRETHLAHDAYAQREEHWSTFTTSPQGTMQWIVVLQKKPRGYKSE